MLREFKLMTFSEFYFYNYIGFMLVSAGMTNHLFRWTTDSAPTYLGWMEPLFGFFKICETRWSKSGVLWNLWKCDILLLLKLFGLMDCHLMSMHMPQDW
jgi:hypothetical protein